MSSFSAPEVSGFRFCAPFKILLKNIHRHIATNDDNIEGLEKSLHSHKIDFLSLLQNPAKNSLHRDEVKRSNTVGIAIQGYSNRHTLSQDFIDEALVISDLLNLNEFAAVDLLIVGEQSQPSFPNLSRGLVAVQLFYDGRRCLIAALRSLLQVSNGRTWTSGLNPTLGGAVTAFCTELIRDGILQRILSCLATLDVPAQVAALSEQRALGAGKHRRIVVDFLDEIDGLLGECAFSVVAQTAPSDDDCAALLDAVRRVGASDFLGGSGLGLVMALLAVLRGGQCPGNPDAFDAAVGSSDGWRTPQLWSVFQFAWGVFLRATAQSDSLQADLAGYAEQDESLVEEAIDNDVFHWLSALVVEAKSFRSEEFYIRNLHEILTDFISLMPQKVKQLRNQSDESSRIAEAHLLQGVAPPADLQHRFLSLLRLLTRMYAEDPFTTSLAFWDAPSDPRSLPSRSSQRRASLHKFLRLAGELLPPTAFPHYVDLLSALSNSQPGALAVYNLLNSNSYNRSASSSVSWQHFFASLSNYYAYLRREAPPNGAYRHAAPVHRTVSPEELQGLLAILRLIRSVCSGSESARRSVADNPQWSSLVTLCGLVTCSVPIGLKAELLRSVAAFAASHQLVPQIWQTLEASQILQTVRPMATVGTPVTQQPSGILLELEEVETRDEDFPMTEAFLELVAALSAHPVPARLGAGSRAPGFDPYLGYVRDNVFIKFPGRVYRRPTGLWDVAHGCLLVFNRLLANYTPRHTDFRETEAKPPGCEILLHFLNDSQSLKRLLWVVAEAIDLLDKHEPSSTPGSVADASLSALELIDSLFRLQSAFLHSAHDAGVIATPFHELLASVNPRTGRSSYVTSVFRYIGHFASLPAHAAIASSIVLHLARFLRKPKDLLTIAAHNASIGERIRQDYVEALDCDYSLGGGVGGQGGGEGGQTPTRTEGSTNSSETSSISLMKRNLLRVLIESLSTFASPSFAHWLLGLVAPATFKPTEPQEPGVLGAPRVCLHSVLSLLDDSNGDSVVKELGHHLVYLLCAEPRTSGPVLRYLQSSHDHFCRHVAGLDPGRLRQMGWLLKATAVEVKLSAQRGQRSNTKRLLQLLVDPPDFDRTDKAKSYIFAEETPEFPRLFELLYGINLSQHQPPTLELRFLDPEEINKAVAEFELETEGVRRVDGRRLHQFLLESLAASQSPGSQREAILQEIDSVLDYCNAVNEIRDQLFGKNLFISGWIQVVSTLVATTPSQLLETNDRIDSIIKIALLILNKVMSHNAIPELTNPLSEVLLVIVSYISHSNKTAVYIGQSDVAVKGHGSRLVVLLKGILDWVLHMGMGGRYHKFRANLYTAVQFLLGSLTVRANEVDDTVDQSDASVVKQVANERDLEVRECWNAVFSYGDSLYEALSRDMCDGPFVCRMVAVATLECIQNNDTRSVVIGYLNNRGFLKYLVDGISSSCDGGDRLKTFWKPDSVTARAIYLYRSKMALLCRVAQTRRGATYLLNLDIMSRIAAAEVLDLRPDGVSGSESDSIRLAFSLDASERYNQILTPVLRLMTAVCSSCGVDNLDASGQCLLALVPHTEVFVAILRGRPNESAVDSLRQIASLTGLLCSALSAGFSRRDSLGADTDGHLRKLHSQLVSMVTVYTDSAVMDKLDSVPSGRSDYKEIYNGEVKRLLVYQTCAHLLTYCKVLTAKSGTATRNLIPLFPPTVTPVSGGSPSATRSSTNKATLSTLIDALRRSARELRIQGKQLVELEEKLSATNESVDLLEDSAGSNQRLENVVDLKRRVVALHKHVIELSLYVMWKHIEFYLVYYSVTVEGKPPTATASGVPPEGGSRLRRLCGGGGDDRIPMSPKSPLSASSPDVTKEVVATLRHELPSLLSGVLEQLSGVDGLFIQALVRRLQRLVKFGGSVGSPFPW